MSAFTIEGFVGEITQQAPEGRANSVGAFHAWTQAERRLLAIRRVKRAGGCKTCQGKGCNGHCRF
jgi:hypothetical protein